MRWLAALFALLIVGSASAAPPMLVATSPHFRIFATEKEGDLRARAEGLERYHAVLHRLTGTRDTDDIVPLTIYVVHDQGAIGAGWNILGYYSAPAAGPFIVVPDKVHGYHTDELPQIILFHEYAHHFMLANFPTLYSPWFVEGFAEFYSTADVSGTDATVGKPELLRIHTLMDHWTTPLASLIVPGEHSLTGLQTDQLYARAWLMVHYLTLSKQRGGQIEAYLKARSGGQTEPDAFQTAFHTSIDGMDGELKAYFATHQLSYVELATPVGETVSVRPATPGETAMADMTPDLRALQEEKAAFAVSKADVMEHDLFLHRAKKLASQVRGLVRKSPDDGALQEFAAECEALADEPDLAATSAREALRLAPGQDRAWLVLADLALAQPPANDRQHLLEARKDVVAANRAAPEDPMPLIAYYQSFVAHGLAAPEIAVEGLSRAQQLAPQNEAVRVMLARERISGKRYAEAANLLRPVAFAPHSSALRRDAQALLKSIPVAQEGAPQPIDGAAPPPPAAPAPATGVATPAKPA